MTNKKDGTLYTGISSYLPKRVWQHKNKIAEGFTKKYQLDRLVYYEIHADANFAIKRERQIKNLVRRRKIGLIEKENPDWKGLCGSLF